jgi:hypothetical protein
MAVSHSALARSLKRPAAKLLHCEAIGEQCGWRCREGRSRPRSLATVRANCAAQVTFVPALCGKWQP